MSVILTLLYFLFYILSCIAFLFGSIILFIGIVEHKSIIENLKKDCISKNKEDKNFCIKISNIAYYVFVIILSVLILSTGFMVSVIHNILFN